MVWRPFYFARLIIDPKNPDRLFKPELQLIVSEDGGKSFAWRSGGGRTATGTTSGSIRRTRSTSSAATTAACGLSYDGGSRWCKADNLPISQFYHVSVDDKDPYQVYGGLQDNSAWVGDSAYPGGITNQPLGEPRRRRRLLGRRSIPPTRRPSTARARAATIDPRRPPHPRRARYPAQGRLQGEAALQLEHADRTSAPRRRARSTSARSSSSARSDHGDTWERISPDLTTNDPEKQKQEQSGGVTVDNSAAEMHTTIYSISESPEGSPR